MQYPKGEFTRVPNRHVLEGMRGATQSVYLWMCFHADENGLCYPAIPKIAKKAGVCDRSASDCINELVQKGILKKTARKKGGGSKENDTNLYQIVLVSKTTPHAAGARPHATGALPLTQQLHDPHAPVAENLNPLTKSIKLNKFPALSEGTAMVGGPSAPMAPDKIPAKNSDPIDAINAVIDEFKLVNEAYAKFFNQPPQRKAVKNLLERHSHQEIVVMLEYARDHNRDEFFPTVYRPQDLEDKWSKLETRRNKKSGKTDAFARTQEEIKNPQPGTTIYNFT